MPTKINGSLNVTSLDSKIVADLCIGKFYIDATPSVFIGAGADSIKGIKIKIVSPHGVVLKDYGAGYDIPSPAVAVYEYNMPTQAGNYQYGRYLISLMLIDSDDASYVIEKAVSPCEPNPLNKLKKTGVVSAKIDAICQQAKAKIYVDNVPTYKGLLAQSQDNNFKLEYPTGSGLEPKEDIYATSFSASLFEGEYKISGSVCATYKATDNVYYKVKYLLNKSKILKCSLDECCVFQKLSELHQNLSSSCSDQERENIASITLDVLRLVTTAKYAASCGEDASDYIMQLEDLLQCKCSSTSESTPLGIIDPARDFVITGCNVQKDTIGLTDYYTIENYEYVVEVNQNNILTVSAPQLNDCKVAYILNFDIVQAYQQVKNLANANNSEASVWAAIINKTLSSLDASVLGFTSVQWSALSFAQKFNELMKKIASCCGCGAEVEIVDIEKVGSDIVIRWDNVNVSVSKSNIYLDGVLVGTVLATTKKFQFFGAADGNDHEYLIEPLCGNGSVGITVQGTFTEVGCAAIPAPNVDSNLIQDAPCPFDLTAIVSGLGVGLTAEWHKSSTPSANSLVGNPAAVAGGIYYVFAKDESGCYSSGVQVSVICEQAVSCTAPQTLVVARTGNYNRVTFQSAAFPPPADSYTVKRRIKSDPDVNGSYTTLGAPVWDASLNRWVLFDATGVSNVLYTYRVVSNCADTQPYIDFDFANIECPAMVLTEGSTNISYEFPHLGGQIDKYEIKIYNSTGTALLGTRTHLPAFPDPISDIFNDLSSKTQYKVGATVYIGTYSKQCELILVRTLDALELPCADVLAEAYPAEPQNGVNNIFGVRVTLDQAYNEDIVVDGLIRGTESYPNTYFTIEIAAGLLSAETGLLYVMSPTEDAEIFLTNIFPEVVTNEGGAVEYSTKCNLLLYDNGGR